MLQENSECSEHAVNQRIDHIVRRILTKEKESVSHGNKVLTQEETSIVVDLLKSHGKQTVLVSGTFDILHIGHISLLEAAKSVGDVLIVATPTDEDIKINKGSARPINPLEHRLYLLSSLEVVDMVFPQSSWLMMEVLDKIRPSVYAVWGKDEHMESRRMQAESFDCRLVLLSSIDDTISTSTLAQRLCLEW